MYQALYRKYRPQTFDDLVGQAAVTTTLKTQLLSGKLSHAYLFTGSRGTGKTSSAKILAKAVNCEAPVDGNPCNCCKACRSIDSGACMDVLEIDAASNNGVDNVRDLRDGAVYTPSEVKKRVYIIDEVHMLSISAFNALLKIIEEPPEHLLFILATTELHKVPATILSRCQRFSFRRISQEDITARLQYVAYQEKIDLDESAARVLARLADGGMRDALSLLDQCASAISGPLSSEQVYRCLGISGVQECTAIMDAIARHDTKGALAVLDKSYSLGKDLSAMLDELICVTRDLMILQTAPQQGISLVSGVASDEQLRHLVDRFSTAELVYMMNALQRTLTALPRNASRRVDAELCIISLCQPELILDAASLNARIARVEQQLKSGDFAAPKKTAPTRQEDEQPPVTDESEAPPQEEKPAALPPSEAPVGFWSDLVRELRTELKPPVSGLFSPQPDSPVQGALVGDTLQIRCANSFIYQVVGKPEIMQLCSRKASQLLGAEVRAVPVDITVKPAASAGMKNLLDFGRGHSGVVTVQED